MEDRKNILQKFLWFKRHDKKETIINNNQDQKNKSLLCNGVDKIYITDNIYIKIPTVGEILNDEKRYYSIVSSLVATPYQYMVQLDDMGINFTKISDYDLFLMLFPLYLSYDLSLIFGDLYVSDYKIKQNKNNGAYVLESNTNGDDYQINEYTYFKIVEALRKINNMERTKFKPGNEHARKYLIDRERKKQKRNANKPYEPFLEKVVIALVNSPEFPYNYEETMGLSIYKFNQSFKQIQTRITFDNTMIGVYAGTVDTSKLSDKSCLSWLQIK